MTEKIKPALTPEEWATFQIVVIDYDGVLVRVRYLAHMPPGGIMQKIAAACLHKQPFGFTHYDLVKLRDALPWNEESEAWLNSLIERIQALLPPSPDATS